MQPALTKSLHEIEATVRTRLFDRHARGVRPMETGMVLVRAARRILAEVRSLDGKLDRHADRMGPRSWMARPRASGCCSTCRQAWNHAVRKPRVQDVMAITWASHPTGQGPARP
ncbi:hypothetical protein VQ02_31210 [Methylobacterium variabile]|jgi:hypothetical protein|uniref:HTH lysR-type domain-containing protein n=2 Tax=Methylobacterium variabile TaxID=298794 RepID=A0A0J6S4Y0_9HYPH|nr:hypothetical protein VQ02_31210 [Methylobacterium variabile]